MHTSSEIPCKLPRKPINIILSDIDFSFYAFLAINA